MVRPGGSTQGACLALGRHIDDSRPGKDGEADMKPEEIIYQWNDDQTINHFAQIQQGINTLSMVIKIQNQRPFVLPYQVIERVPARPKPVLDFPFNVLDAAIERFLNRVVVHWIVRIRRLLGLTKPRKV